MHSPRLRRPPPSWAAVALALMLVACGGESGASPGRDGAASRQQAPLFEPPPGLASDVAAHIEDVRVAAASAPADPAAQLRMGMVLDAHGLAESAARWYRHVLELPAQGADITPIHARAQYHLARQHAELGDVPAAIAAVTRSCALAPGHAPGWARLGRWQLQLGQLDAASEAFLRALDVAAHLPAAIEGLARVDLERDDAAGALTRLAPLLARDPQAAHARHLRGTALRRLGRMDEARADLAAGAGTPPTWHDSWEDEVAALAAGHLALMDGIILAGRSGRAADVLPLLEQLHERDPQDVTVLEKLVGARLELQQLDLARAAMEAARARQPRHPRVWALSALVLEQAGRFPEARVHAERAVDLADSWARGHELLARLRWKTNDIAGAAEALQHAVARGAGIEARLKRARALTTLGRDADALVELRAAVRHHPDHAQAQQMLAQAERDAEADR